MLRTNVGIAVRAAADNADRALLYGDPDPAAVDDRVDGRRRHRRADVHPQGTLRRVRPSTALGASRYAACCRRSRPPSSRGWSRFRVAFVAGVGLEILSQLDVLEHASRRRRATSRSSSSSSSRSSLQRARTVPRARTGQHVVDGGGPPSDTRASCKNLPEVRITKYVGHRGRCCFVAIYVPLQLDAGNREPHGRRRRLGDRRRVARRADGLGRTHQPRSVRDRRRRRDHVRQHRPRGRTSTCSSSCLVAGLAGGAHRAAHRSAGAADPRACSSP